MHETNQGCILVSGPYCIVWISTCHCQARERGNTFFPKNKNKKKIKEEAHIWSQRSQPHVIIINRPRLFKQSKMKLWSN